jgi:hypothetical protein
MQRYFDVVQTTAGNAVPGALVYVYVGSTTVLATLFSDNSVTAAPNPLTTNADGEYAFYAANGTYTIQIAATGYAGETKPGAVLFDPSDAGASNNVQFLQAGTGAQMRSVQSKLRDVVSVKDFGGVCDGVVDDTTALVNAQAAAAISGATVLVPGPTKFSSTLSLASGVSWDFSSGASLIWAGSTSGTCVTTGNQVYQNARWAGMSINTGPSFTGVALYFRSSHNVYADVVRLVTTGTNSTAIRMWADSTIGGDSLTKRNITGVTIGSIVHQGQCGTLMDFDGVAVGYLGDPQVVTLCNFLSIFAENCAQYGIRIRNWTDNNAFSGTTRVMLNGNNAVGLQHGEAASQGVYMNQFSIFAADTFGTFAGRVGVKVDTSKLLDIKALYQNPPAEGGEFVAAANAESYNVVFFKDSTKDIITYRRKASAASEGWNSSPAITLDDDTATSFVITGGGADENITFILSVSTNDANANGILWMKCRRTSGVAAVSLIAGGLNFAVATGPLNGTTGVDTKFTVSANNDGKFYVENRLGAQVKFTTHIAAWMQTP